MLKKPEILDKFIKDKRKTTIIISHRISSFKNTNKIIVLENGKLKKLEIIKKLISDQGFYSQNVQITA